MLAANDNEPKPICVVAADENWIGHAYLNSDMANRMSLLYPASVWLRKGSSFFRARHALDYSAFQGFARDGYEYVEIGHLGFDDDIENIHPID